ncbi:unnamed protein product, partial [Urochloa humidicola]
RGGAGDEAAARGDGLAARGVGLAARRISPDSKHCLVNGDRFPSDVDAPRPLLAGWKGEMMPPVRSVPPLDAAGVGHGKRSGATACTGEKRRKTVAAPSPPLGL